MPTNGASDKRNYLPLQQLQESRRDEREAVVVRVDQLEVADGIDSLKLCVVARATSSGEITARL